MNESIREVILRYQRKDEDTRPHGGIYYIVRMKDGHEEILSEFFDDPSEAVLHNDFWKNKVIANVLKDEYGLTQEQANELAQYPHGMVRGRVSMPSWDSLGRQTGKWLITYGGNDEFPPGRHGEILQQFNLTQLYAYDKVAFVVLKHEKMDPAHKAAVERILGIQI